MGRLIGIIRPDWTPVTGRRPASDELERYARYEYGEPRADWLRVAPLRNGEGPTGCAREPHGDWTLFERLARAVVSFF